MSLQLSSEVSSLHGSLAAIEGSSTRRQPRSSMFLAAVMRAGSEQAPVRVRNMSASGALIETPIAPSPGTEVDLRRGALVARGTVAWSAANRCGLHFSSKVSVQDWMAAPGKLGQQRVDEIVALVKSGGAGPIKEATTEASRSHHQLTEDLGEVVKLMQDLENDLSSSSATLERHGMKLQHLDIAMQMLRAVAAELTPAHGTSVSNAKLKDLRLACSQALGAREDSAQPRAGSLETRPKC